MFVRPRKPRVPEPNVVPAIDYMLGHTEETALKKYGPSVIIQFRTIRKAVTEATVTHKSRDDAIARERDLIRRGDEQFQKSKANEAITYYGQAIAVRPASFDGRARIVAVSFAKGDYPEAARLLRETIAAVPRGLLQKGSNVEAMFGGPKNFLVAVNRLEGHLKESPEDREGQLVLAAQLLLSDRPEMALHALERPELKGKKGQVDPVLVELTRAALDRKRAKATAAR